MRFGLIAVAVLFGLAACGEPRRGGLAPVTAHTVEEPAPPSSAGAVVVAAGDTVYSIARRYGVPTRDLMELNGLAPPYALRIGQRLVLPTARYHTVQGGDTLYSISRLYKVDMAELARTNALAPPYGIRIGQQLRVPGGGDVPGTPVVASVPVPSRKPGSTTPMMASPVTAAYPGAREAAPAMPVRTAALLPPPLAKPVQPVAGALPATTRPVQPAPPARTQAPPPVKEVPARAGARFAWPVRGTILSAFGPKPDGLHNDGLNIGAPRGTAVVAAENGVVAYAGNELRGFGNLLLIRHADGWMSAYAHLDTMLVERGATVERGQKIGTVGATGSVSVPQLHFELRQGSRAVDPRDHMAPAGSPGKVKRAAFRAGQPGPG